MTPTTDPPTPLDELLNAPAEFAMPDGRVVRIGDLTEDNRAKFVRRLKDRAVLEMATFPEETPPAVLRVYADSVTEGLSSGVYDWGGSACVKALATPWGGTYAFYLAVSQSDPLYTEEEAAADWQAAVRSRLKELVEKTMHRAVSDPPA